MFERAFGSSTRWSLGVEEELFLVSAANHRPAAAPPGLLDGALLRPELFPSVVELATPVCRGAYEAGEALAALRAGAARGAADHGLALLAAGTHPLARLEEQEPGGDAALGKFVTYAGPVAAVQYCCGLHVHVGVATPEECLAAIEGVLPWLPLVLALSASSPYLDGREAGLASARAELLARLPRSGAPPPFATLEDWERFARRLVALGLADDYRRLWWDVRPHPRLGTVEVRIPDQPTRASTSAAFAALVQALVASARPGGQADRGVYAENRFAAMRFGAAARLVHPLRDRLVTVPELLDELLERVGPVAESLGGAPLLASLRPLARRAQADEQLAVGRTEGLDALVAGLVASTLA